MINLNDSTNGFNGVVSLTNSGANAVTFKNTTALLTLGTTTVGSATLDITNIGALTNSAAITSSGGDVKLTTLSPDASEPALNVDSTISTNGGSIVLTAANNSTGTANALFVNSALNTTPGPGGTLTLCGGFKY